MAWKGVDHFYANSYAAFLPLSSIAIGLTVRYAGRGITMPFQAVALVSFIILCIMMYAFLGVRIRGPVPMLVPGVLFLGGLALCGWLSRRELDQQQEIAFWKIFVAGRDHPAHHSPWLMVPLAIALQLAVIPLAMMLSGAASFRGPTVAEQQAEVDMYAYINTPEFAEQARRLGRPLGYESTAAFCHQVTEQRLATCSDLVCEAQNPFILEGCLETVGKVLEDDLQ